MKVEFKNEYECKNKAFGEKDDNQFVLSAKSIVLIKFIINYVFTKIKIAEFQTIKV